MINEGKHFLATRGICAQLPTCEESSLDKGCSNGAVNLGRAIVLWKLPGNGGAELLDRSIPRSLVKECLYLKDI